ncbi:unnamed protein product [Peniophora sp. CBMAI 1063]|nr:unnamed protein product [Peniophora sp. CBMAI 1063]
MVHSSRPRRHFIKRKRGDAHLEERDPSLINLPFPVPSIPIISNLLDPLISGEKPQSSSSAQAPAPTATSVPSSPDNSGSGDNSASSSDSGDNGSSASDNDTGSESGSSSSSGTGSGSNGSSPTVSTPASNPTVATGKGSASVDTSDAKPTSSQGAVASPSVASTSVAAAATTSATSEATDVNVESAGSATSTATNAPSSPIANVAVAVNDNASLSAAQAVGASSSHSAQPTAIGSLGAGVGSSSSSSSDTNSGTSSATDNNNNSSSVIAANHSSLSGGAIAGIIIAALIAGGLLIIFVMRRRSMNKRKARQTAWFFGRNASSTNVDPAARISTRSSWGTPFDGRALYTDAMSPTPDSAPNTMAQLNSAPLTAPPVVVTQKENTRASMYSIGSASSEGSGEGLPLPAPVYGEEMPSTPMSARAFSPMDGHSFPKPPSTTSSHGKEEKRKSVDELIDLNNPFADRLPPGASPFADPVVPVTPGARASVGSSVGSAGSVIGIGTRVTIARPFTPSLHDEIGVSPGDEVIVLQAFDDGWVQVRNADKNVGLVPLDCFRPEGQDTAAFLASKRPPSNVSETEYTTSREPLYPRRPLLSSLDLTFLSPQRSMFAQPIPPSSAFSSLTAYATPFVDVQTLSTPSLDPLRL